MNQDQHVCLSETKPTSWERRLARHKCCGDDGFGLAVKACWVVQCARTVAGGGVHARCLAEAGLTGAPCMWRGMWGEFARLHCTISDTVSDNVEWLLSVRESHCIVSSHASFVVVTSPRHESRRDDVTTAHPHVPYVG